MLLHSTPLSYIFLLWTCCLREAASVIPSEAHKNKVNGHNNKALVPKASLTQKGYIQFLKYVVEVPEIAEYTFCIWVKSYNFTFSHPLLSYSRHEQDRFIRVWISPHGSHLNLELLQVPVFSIPLHAQEHQWYHICQSWSAPKAAWSVFLNGQLRANGHQPKLHNMRIPSRGDLVVGQEYTDFDKGLDDGIEGEISGFNFVLESTFPRASDHLFAMDNLIQKRSMLWKKHLDSMLHQMPLGLILVQLGRDCEYLRGAPLKGKKVLINWTKTEVRVFGGAILKTVSRFC
ncbi:neuronal pentraxin receptor-like [Euwallacea fornicatus]|uniref:neuronal pentraxin receptor-like n=1 Tax=Euwallacea fornicatus TaxID=995702 RepID=UPI00338DD82A